MARWWRCGIGSICSGSLILARLGLLEGKTATTYPTSKAVLESFGVEVIEKPFVAHGRTATAGGCLAQQYLIHWVIENLVDNAVSFSPPNGVISVCVRREGDKVVATVCDEGPGIPEAEREKVFARFHTARPEGEGFGNHSGLGLAIARTIAEAHDGTLSVADRADGKPGACLVLELPAT